MDEEEPEIEVVVYEITPKVITRVLGKTVIPDDEEHECWEWQGSRTYDGYGHVSVGGKLFLAHRVLYVVYKGEIPSGLVLLHSCDNRKCVSPHHLRVGTQAENLQDMHNKGRWRRKPHAQSKGTARDA